MRTTVAQTSAIRGRKYMGATLPIRRVSVKTDSVFESVATQDLELFFRCFPIKIRRGLGGPSMKDRWSRSKAMDTMSSVIKLLIEATHDVPACIDV